MKNLDMNDKKYKTVLTCITLAPFFVLFVAFCILAYRDKNKSEEIALLKKEIEFYKAKAEQGYLIDSIEFNIVKQDSIITETKKSYIYEIELVEANNDVDALAQFKELIGAE